MNDKQYAYIMTHWYEYDLVNCKEDMRKLLNILQAHDENLDALHDVCVNGRNSFCGICGTYENEREIVEVLFEYHAFFKNATELRKRIEEDAKEAGEEPDDYAKYEDIRQTRDGYILVMEC